MKVRLGSLHPGEEFETCLTGLRGIVTQRAAIWKAESGVQVVFPHGDKSVHANVIVYAAKGLQVH
jgi:hypothetical protein